ncbi:MAG: flagellar assembly protein FliX [Alphaproteobacteria bacterium]|nr:flagellar assembly protein FliX [Alphaproteobacteria bacterium]
MKIQGLSDIRRLWEARAKKKASGSSEFSSLIEEPSTPAESASFTSAPAPVASLSTVLALQEVQDDDVRARREAVNRGNHLLDELEGLRRALLEGRITEAQVNRLEILLKRENPAYSDPELKAILDDIELRAAVELAKLRLVD